MKAYDKLVLGHIVLAHKEIQSGYVAISNGVVMEVAMINSSKLPPAKEIHDFSGYYIFPSVIDSQVHSRSQAGQEDFIYSSASGAAGGVGTIIDMPYDAGRLICNEQAFNAKKQEAKAQTRVDFGLYATINPLEGSRHIEELIQAGAIGFKFSTFGTDPTRFPRIPPYIMQECFAKIAPYGLVAGVHNEDDESIKYLIEFYQNQGITDYKAHNLSRPIWTENIAIAQIYELGAQTGCHAHVVHCSNPRGYEICAGYQKQGFCVSIEACLHYLVLSEEEDVSGLVGKAKVNPPIRSLKDKEALWKHLDCGNITVVSTDHVSWSEDRKSFANMFKNSSGATGLEVLLPLMLTEAHKRGISFSKIVRVLSYNPARLFHINHKKGALEIGRDADLVILSKENYLYDAGRSGVNFVSWSPYDGREIDFRVKKHMLRGEWIFDDGKVLASPGFGEFVSPMK
ncbi:amidohydrolase family protein [Helicobacter sp. 11S03491-1]|uniref:dihydroorotase n=1 Tax=Helicobacter sp. 11S03491-1 TaxID=1476196 RepID=UPI000BA7631E|nr:amidohydrolase family protein [Helicobacter sp. 11S03491-1]PAF43425.1 allantoinase [Helicobacter sp. 11S03491-1]